LAAGIAGAQLERAINEADKFDLIDIGELRAMLCGRTKGERILRELLDRRTFALTDSELERRFLRVARQAGLPKPLTGAAVGGYRADFYWPALGLVVETDGLRYHRTPAQQAKDRERDQAYAIAGLTPLRFTHAQIAFEADKVIAALRAVAERLAGAHN
jgi:very-short-patch-repair endonuclease